MKIIGLTGSIAMGKSTTAQMLRRMRVPVFDADAAVHELQKPGGKAIPLIAAAFPGAVKNAVLDRNALRALVFANPQAKAKLEAIMHPLVAAAQRRFLRLQRLRRAPLVVLDIPLLFEGTGWKKTHANIVVSAPAHVQKARVLARPGMTAEIFARILATQVPDAEKRRRADYIVRTGLGKRIAWCDLHRALRAVLGQNLVSDDA